MKLFLIRHGQTTANLNKIYAGHSDVLLTEQGRQEAEQLRPILAQFHFDRVFSSDLTRTVETQKLAIPGATAERTPLLREYDVGSLVGMGFQEAREKYSDRFRTIRDYSPFGGESSDMVAARVRKFLSALEEDPCENAVAFVHNGVMNAMLQIVLNADYDRTAVYSNNCAIHVFRFENGRWQLLAWNYMGKI